MPEPKKVALFLDGTWNTVDNNTNIWRMKSLFVADTSQVAYYSAGVGTQRGEKVFGGLWGYGLDAEVISAYEWLIENYNDGDHIYIFGFSRGAFTARSLAGLVSKCGLLKAGCPMSLSQLYNRYRLGTAAHTIRELSKVSAASLKPEDTWLLKYSRPIPIFFQGVYDTVGALGVPFGNVPLISRSNYSFLETDLRISDARAFHALAIDEHRKAFAPTLWTRTQADNSQAYAARPIEHVEQRWFIGAHADVGGGYSNGILSQIPLQWLIHKAQLHGLNIIDPYALDGTEYRAPIHDSFAEMAGGVYRAFKMWRPFFRRIGAAPSAENGATTTTINETIDASVFARWRNDTTYRPLNLKTWARMRSLDLQSLNDSVLADGTPVPPPPPALAALR